MIRKPTLNICMYSLNRNLSPFGGQCFHQLKSPQSESHLGLMFCKSIDWFLHKKHWSCFLKKLLVMENFEIFTEKHLCWSLFLARVSNTDVFMWILQNFKKQLFIELLRWLLLIILYFGSSSKSRAP